MKLDWRKTFLIGLGFLGIRVIWRVYNAFVPIFLQAGHPEFHSSQGVFGFGLDATMTGLIMGIDNFAALIILPLVGVWSDSIHTRIGKRYPFIITATLIVAIAMLLLPFANGRLDAVTNGQIATVQFAFGLFMTGLVLLVLAMAFLRTPVMALMSDLTPFSLRSKANGVINFMGGLGGILAAFGLTRLFDLNQKLPFISATFTLLGAVVLLFLFVKEPHAEKAPDAQSLQQIYSISNLKEIPRQQRSNIILLLVTIVLWFIGYDSVVTFFTSYAVSTLGIREGLAPTLTGIASIAFVVSAIPAGFIGDRIGRRQTITIGLVIMAVLVFEYFNTYVLVTAIILAISGIGWALININALPMVVNMIEDARLIGTSTGLYFFAAQFGSTISPFLTGGIIDHFGSNYRVIFVVSFIFFLLAGVCLHFIRHDESTDIGNPR